MLRPAALTAVGVGIDTLRVNPLRTALSTLGVIIGVASLVAVLSLGDGMEASAREQIERTTGVQVVTVSPRTSEVVDGQRFPIRDYPVFTPRDAEAARDEIEGVAAVALHVTGSVPVDAPETGKRRMVSVTAALAGADRFTRMDFAVGRFFSEIEEQHNTPVVVISHKLAVELAAGRSPLTLPGRTVRVQGSPREVIGILAPYKGEVGYAAYVPFSAKASVFSGASSPPVISLKAQRVEEVDALKARAEDWLATRLSRWERRAQVQTSLARLEQAQTGIALFKMFMGALTGISLLVGGIGIMNVLLASVTERTREIGIRKATGARGRDILMQFLAESVAISGAGSMVGVLLGAAGSFIISAIMRAAMQGVVIQASLSWSTVAVAALSAIAVGLVFGTYPARRAARLSPIDAIRHE